MKKNGKTLKGIQRHLCKQCGSTKQEAYSNRAYFAETNTNIVLLIKEGVGVRSIKKQVDNSIFQWVLPIFILQKQGKKFFELNNNHLGNVFS